MNSRRSCRPCRSVLSFLCFIILSALLAGGAVAQVGPLVEMRDWTSDDGKTIRAELIDYNGNEAQLRLENGQRVSVPDSRFSRLDQAELVRAYIGKNTWSILPPPQTTRYYYSLITSENATHEKIVSQIAFGPGSFSYGIKIHSTTIDFVEYDSLIFADGKGGTYQLDFKGAEVAGWGDPGREVSRIVASIRSDQGLPLVPVLKQGLGSGTLTVEARGRGKDPYRLEISREEMEALEDLFSIFLKALPLVQSGVIKKALLENQQFDSGITDPGVSMTAKEDSELERFRSSRGGGRFGEITWTPAGGEVQAVRGLGWVGKSVVIRTAEEEVKQVPFSEIDPENQKRILEARLDDFAGEDPLSDEVWISYYSKALKGNQTTYSHGLVFKEGSKTGKPHLFVQTYATKFEGRGISSFLISGDSLPGGVRVPNERTRTVKGNDNSWSLASQNIVGEPLNTLSGLVDSKAIKILVNSGDDFTTVILEGDDVIPSIEALACYLWAKEIDR